MSSPVAVNRQPGLEVDWRQQQFENEQPRKQQQDNEGLQPYIPYPDGVAGNYSSDSSRRIMGLSTGIFWLVVGLIVLVLAGGIGGGVAGGLAAQKNSCPQSQSPTSTSRTLASATPAPSSSSSTSSTTTSAATSSPSPEISTPCTTSPSNNGTTLTAYDPTGSNAAIGSVTHNFLLLCNTNYPAGAAYGNPNLIDLYRLYTPDMAGCIAACAEYNIAYAVQSGSPPCAAVAVVKSPGEFCYLKSATGVNNTSSSGGRPIDTAILIT